MVGLKSHYGNIGTVEWPLIHAFAVQSTHGLVYTPYKLAGRADQLPILWGAPTPTLSHGRPHDRPYRGKNVNAPPHESASHTLG